MAVAGHSAAVAVGGALHTVLDVEPGHGAIHGAEGLVLLRAGAEAEAGAGGAAGAAGVSVEDQELAG